MRTESTSFQVADLQVELVRKAIRNLHVGVYPPFGRVRVAAPQQLSDEAVRLAVVRRLGWIRRRQAELAGQARQSQREMVDGESHYFQGRRYRLRVIEANGRLGVTLRRPSTLELRVRPDSTAEQRRAALSRWYRRQLRNLATPLVERWQEELNIQAAEWGIKQMRTRWGTCNPKARRIWLNLELAKKPPHCLEYIVVHELAHLLHRRHDAPFQSLLDRHLPQWRAFRAELNAAPLGHEDRLR